MLPKLCSLPLRSPSSDLSAGQRTLGQHPCNSLPPHHVCSTVKACSSLVSIISTVAGVSTISPLCYCCGFLILCHLLIRFPESCCRGLFKTVRLIPSPTDEEFCLANSPKSRLPAMVPKSLDNITRLPDQPQPLSHFLGLATMAFRMPAIFFPLANSTVLLAPVQSLELKSNITSGRMVPCCVCCGMAASAAPQAAGCMQAGLLHYRVSQKLTLCLTTSQELDYIFWVNLRSC